VKLGEALSELKKEKSALARLISLRKNNTMLPEGEKPVFDPKVLTRKIRQRTAYIRKLKLDIQLTNMENPISGSKKSIAKAIIEINDLRSELASLSTLYERTSFLYRDKEEKLVDHMSREEVEKEIRRLQIEKTKLDNALQKANWSTDLSSSARG